MYILDIHQKGLARSQYSINNRSRLVEYGCHRSIMSLLATSPQPPCITRSDSEPGCPFMNHDSCSLGLDPGIVCETRTKAQRISYGTRQYTLMSREELSLSLC